MSNKQGDSDIPKVRLIPLSYVNAESQSSALRLILTLCPDWEHAQGKIEFVRFTDGITNTLLKAIKRRPGYTDEQIDKDAVLLRAYGSGTEVLIDRNRETISHSLLSQHGLAPPLLARFQNGLLYRFIRGRVCTSEDLAREQIWRGVARRLAEWHAVLPITAEPGTTRPKSKEKPNGWKLPLPLPSPPQTRLSPEDVSPLVPGKIAPNLWTVLQKWICALPTRTESEKHRKILLQNELQRTVTDLGDRPGLGQDGLVFGHCDLLSGNVIIHPESPGSKPPSVSTVSFIDYEYATPCPAAFDIANHFAEWGGLSCDYSVLPTRSQRRAFVQEYLASFARHSPCPTSEEAEGSDDSEHTDVSERSSDAESMDVWETRLFEEVDLFRGVPGLYWGVWGLIQAEISQIDFDYGTYAEVRLSEYWAWRAERDGSREGALPERERRWAEE